MSQGWWPYGEMAEQLANLVIDGSAEARQLAREIINLAAKRRNYDALVKRLCTEVEACRWSSVDEILKEMELFEDMVKVDLTYYQTAVAFERECTVLDRIEESTRD